MKRCIVCDTPAALGPGLVCAACSDEIPEGPLTQDPLADAVATGLTFEASQYRWLAHHVSNAAQGAISLDPRIREQAILRIRAILDAVKKQVRPPL